MRPLGVLICLLIVSACAPNYSDGSRMGVVTKLSQKGLFFKSWEGEMLVALPIEVAGNTQPEKFEFNVDPQVIDKVQKAMASGKRVELVYRQWAIGPPTIDSDHVVIDVKAMQ